MNTDNYRRWTTLEVPLGARIRAKDGMFKGYLCEAHVDHVETYSGYTLSLSDLLENYEYYPGPYEPTSEDQWLPCGVKI